MYILEQTLDADGVETFRMSEGPQVFVSHHLVGFVGEHPSNVDYYYEERGYGCQSRREVAIVFASEHRAAPAVQGQMFPAGDDLPLFTAS